MALYRCTVLAYVTVSVQSDSSESFSTPWFRDGLTSSSWPNIGVYKLHASVRTSNSGSNED